MKKYSVKKLVFILFLILVAVSLIGYVIYRIITKDKPKGMDYRESNVPAYGLGNVDADSKKRLTINFFKLRPL